MKKETLLEIILGTIGGLSFALGMCMCLLPKWNLLKPGLVVGVIGILILLCIIPVYRKNHPKKPHKPINLSIVLTIIIGIIGALILGFGMSKIMVQGDMIIGMITGVIGLITCILNYPIYSYISNKNNEKIIR